MIFYTKLETDAESREAYRRDADSEKQMKPIEASERHVATGRTLCSHVDSPTLA
jgi:hypothetical protein